MPTSSTPAASLNVAHACPVCGAPAEMYRDESVRCTFARCHGCDSAWVPLDEWNNDRLAVSEIPPARALFEQSRARLAMVAKEGSPVWGEFRREVEELAPAAKAIVVTSVDQKEAMRLARIHRLKLRDIRLDMVATHKDEKAESLAKGQALDAAKRELLAVIEPLEQHLLEQEEFEKRTIAAEMEARQREREEILRGFVDNPETLPLAEMTQADFIALCDFHETRWYAKRDAELKAAAEEAARVQREADDREAVRLEVERLRAEVTARVEAEAAATRAQRAAEAALKRQQDEAAAAQQAERAAADAASKAPDREKLLAFANRLLSIDEPEMETADGKWALQEANNGISELVDWVRSRAESL